MNDSSLAVEMKIQMQTGHFDIISNTANEKFNNGFKNFALLILQTLQSM